MHNLGLFATPQPVAQEMGLVEQIVKLAEMKKQGILSEHEFLKAKAKLLD